MRPNFSLDEALSTLQLRRLRALASHLNHNLILQMADEKIIFSMAGVNKIYPPSKQVLKNIYLSFFYGAKIGVLGLNGSGKSCLLRIIAGIDKEFQGEVVSDLCFSVGLLEQEPQLDKSKTVKEIVEEGVKDVVGLA